MAVAVGAGVVEILANLRPFYQGLNQARYSLRAFVQGTQSLQAAMSYTGAAVGVGAGVAAIAATTSLLMKATQAAASLRETMNQISVVFGKAQDRAIGFADVMAERFGLARNEVLKAELSLGAIAKAAGLDQIAAQEFAEAMVRAADDASSFKDVELDVALRKIEAGLVGQIRPLREWGVLLSAEAVKQEAARLGLAKYGATLSEQVKVLARASLITKGMKDMIGDHERTMDSSKNRQRAILGAIENAYTRLGALVEPIWNDILGVVESSVRGIDKWLTDNEGAIRDWLGEFRTTVHDLQEGFGPLIELGSYWAESFVGELRAVIELIRQVNHAIQGLSRGYAQSSEYIAGMMNAIESGPLETAGQRVVAWHKQWQQMQQDKEEQKTQQEAGEAGKKLKGIGQKGNAPLPGVNADEEDEEGVASHKKPKKHSFFAGVEERAKQIQEAISGENVAKQQLIEQKKQTEVLEGIKKNTASAVGKSAVAAGVPF